MKVNLSLKQAYLKVRHTKHTEDLPRKTIAILEVDDVYGDKRQYYVEAVCSPDDQFNKKVGRKLVANRLLQKLRSEYDMNKLTEADRRSIFTTICPEYKRSSKSKKRKARG